MNTMSLRTSDGRMGFEPGEEIEFIAAWQFDDPPKGGLEWRLGWNTNGKGDCDELIIDRCPIPNPDPEGSLGWRLVLPESPYSFSGKLISLVWSIELAQLPKGPIERLEFTLAPTGQEILLHPAK